MSSPPGTGGAGDATAGPGPGERGRANPTSPAPPRTTPAVLLTLGVAVGMLASHVVNFVAGSRWYYEQPRHLWNGPRLWAYATLLVGVAIVAGIGRRFVRGPVHVALVCVTVVVGLVLLAVWWMMTTLVGMRS